MASMNTLHADPNNELGTNLLTIGLESNLAPYSFRHGEDEMQGIAPDLWRLWSKKTGIPIRLVPIDWNTSLELMETGRVDVIGILPKSRAPAALLLYSDKPLYTSSMFAFYEKHLPDVKDVESMKPFTIGSVKQGSCADWLKTNDFPNIRYFPNFQSMADAAANGDLDVFCSGRKNAISTLASHSPPRDFKQSPLCSKLTVIGLYPNRNRNFTIPLNMVSD